VGGREGWTEKTERRLRRAVTGEKEEIEESSDGKRGD